MRFDLRINPAHVIPCTRALLLVQDPVSSTLRPCSQSPSGALNGLVLFLRSPPQTKHTSVSCNSSLSVISWISHTASCVFDALVLYNYVRQKSDRFESIFPPSDLTGWLIGRMIPRNRTIQALRRVKVRASPAPRARAYA
jgi:hypothetical protein